MDKPLDALGLSIQEWMDLYTEGFNFTNGVRRCAMCGKETQRFERYTRTPLHEGLCAEKFANYMRRAYTEGHS